MARRERSSHSNEVDNAIAQIASRQHGLITAEQLVRWLPYRSQVQTRVANGRLHRLHRGVYAVGHVAPSTDRDCLAAVLACGPGAAASHFAAAELWRIWRNTRRPVDVSVPTAGGRAQREGIRVHRRRELRTTTVRGIPVTTLPQTLADLRPLLPRATWLRAAHEARVQYGVHVDDQVTLSRLERRLLAICRQHGLPAPETNVLVAGARGEHRVDALFREAGLVVEVDGYEVHASRHAFTADRERTADLEDAGLRVLRVAEDQLGDGARVARRIETRLYQRDRWWAGA